MIYPITLEQPRVRICKCCGQFWIPLPGDTAATCLRCDLEALRDFGNDKDQQEKDKVNGTNSN